MQSSLIKGPVDSAPPTALDFSSAVGRQLNQTVYAAHDLDPSRLHVLKLWYDDATWSNVTSARKYVNVDAMYITYPEGLGR